LRFLREWKSRMAGPKRTLELQRRRRWNNDSTPIPVQVPPPPPGSPQVVGIFWRAQQRAGSDRGKRSGLLRSAVRARRGLKGDEWAASSVSLPGPIRIGESFTRGIRTSWDPAVFVTDRIFLEPANRAATGSPSLIESLLSDDDLRLTGQEG